MCCVPALNKLRLAMMAMITMTTKMITQTAIEDSGGSLVAEEESVTTTGVGMQVFLREKVMRGSSRT
jgi:hypothetical protein